MNYELQLWNGTEYQRHESHTDPAELRGIYRRNFTGGYRIVNRDRRYLDNTTLPLKPARKNWGSTHHKRRSANDGLSLHQQAQLAGEHYRRLREASDADLLPVHVYPVPSSGRGTSAEFRALLAMELTGRQHYRESAYITRDLNAAGYHFVEVDLEDYS